MLGFQSLLLCAVGFVQTVPTLPLDHYAAGGKKGLLIMEVDVGVDIHEGSVEEKFHLNLG